MDTTNSNPTVPAVSDAAREAGTQAAGVASTAAEQTTQVASTAVESGKWVAAVGQSEAKNVASTAAEQAGQVVGEVGAQARNLVDESKNQLRAQAQSQTDQIAAKLRELGDQVQALAEGRAQDAGPIGDYARQAAQTVTQFAGRVEDRGLEGIVDDVQRFARRKPGTFLLGAAIAGFGVGRLLRAGAMSGATEQQTSPTLQRDQQADLEAAAYAPYEALGVSTQPPLVDVSDGTVAAMASIDDTDGTIADAAIDPTPPAGVTATSPMSAPTDPGRIR